MIAKELYPQAKKARNIKYQKGITRALAGDNKVRGQKF